MELVGKPDDIGDPTDHGGLTGLDDDDHEQYLTEDRGDARYHPLSTDFATQTELNDHLGDALDAHDAAAISISDAGGNFDAANVEAALAEIVLNTGTVNSALDQHLADTTDAHDASAISLLDAGGDFAATNVETALAELATEDETINTALGAHIDDAVNAHEASAIHYGGSAGLAASTVEAALDELDSEKANVGGIVLVGGAAGGALDGTYPNPGIAASVAGNGLAETTNVLSVNVDAVGIEISSDALRLKDAGVTAAKLATNSVTTGKITDANVTTAKIADNNVTTAKIAAGAVTAAKVAADVATQAELDAHTAQAVDAHDASAISVADVGGVFTATTVEAALAELYAAGVVADHGGLTGLSDDDHLQYHNDTRGDARYWMLSTNLATQVELDAHTGDATDAHDASAISILDAGGNYTATDVEGALTEIDTRFDSFVPGGHKATHEVGGADEISLTGLDGVSTELAAHLADSVDAHGAEAISVTDGGGYYVTDDLESILQQIGASGGGGGGSNPLGPAGGVLDGTYPNPGLAAGVAGAGLAETADVLSVNVDGSTLEINSDSLRVKAGGITAAHVAADVATQAELDAVSAGAIPSSRNLTAGDGLSGGGDLSADRTFTVNTDGSTIETSSDALRVKDAGVTNAKLATAAKTVALTFQFDGNGAAIAAGSKTPILYVPFSGTIVKSTILADLSGACVVDILKDAYASSPPTTSICGAGTKPTLSSQDQNQDSSLTSWTGTAISAGDVMRGSISGTPTTCTMVTVTLDVVKS